MGFGGSIAAMMQSLKSNKAQLKTSTSYFEKDTKDPQRYGVFVDHKKMTPEQFEAYKKTLKQESKENQKRFLIVMGGIIIFIIGDAFLFLFT